MFIHIIGTNHSSQLCGNATGDADGFHEFLLVACNRVQPELIAEEMSEEGLSRWNAPDSVPRIVAQQRGLLHMFCDPDTEQRRSLGILDSKELILKLNLGKFLSAEEEASLEAEERKQWPVREAFWLKCLAHAGASKALFVVGKNHVDSFATLAALQGLHPDIYTRDWRARP